MPKSTQWILRPTPTSRRFWTSWKPSARSAAIRAIWLWQLPELARQSSLHWTTSVSANRTRTSPAVCSLWCTGKKSSSRACTPSAPCSRMPILAKCLWATTSPRVSTICLFPSRPSTLRTLLQRHHRSFMTTSSWMSSTMRQLRPIRNCWPTISLAFCWA